MPLLFLFLIAMVVRNVTLPGAMEGITFYLKPDFSKITAELFVFVLGQVFFALSLGFGVMITLSSYLDKKRKSGSDGSHYRHYQYHHRRVGGLYDFPVALQLRRRTQFRPDFGIPELADCILEYVGRPCVRRDFLLAAPDCRADDFADDL